MTKRLRPEEEAVKRSPTLELSTTKVAKEVAPEIEAVGVVPLEARASRVARGEVVPKPRRLVVSSKKKLALSWANFPVESMKTTEPSVKLGLRVP